MILLLFIFTTSNANLLITPDEESNISFADLYETEHGPEPEEFMKTAKRKVDFADDIIIDGDMILSKEQAVYYLNIGPERKTYKSNKFLWPKAKIPYAIHESSMPDEAVIKEGLQMWEKSTCLTFPRVSSDSKIHHIYFTKGKGCYSYTGRTKKKDVNGQIISIGRGCNEPGIVAHEVGHAISFFHEQKRPDRNDHIIILEDNILPRKRRNYDASPRIDSKNIAYDVSSLMHYSGITFTANGKSTMVTKDPWDQLVMGQRNNLSFADLKLAHLLYNCSAKCKRKKKCANEGFLDKNCKCHCAPGFIGNQCKKKSTIAKECGFIIDKAQEISSPSIKPDNFKEMKCTWNIRAPEEKHVTIHFREFRLHKRHNATSRCSKSRLEIRTKDKYIGDYYCENELQNETLSSKGSEMWLFLHNEKTDSVKMGFKAQITFTDENECKSSEKPGPKRKKNS